MSGRDFSKPTQPRYYCLNRNCHQEVYRYGKEPYPHLCYDCQRKSDKETQATKPKDNKNPNYKKSL